MGFIVSRLNAFIINRSGGVVADLQAQGVDLSPFIRYDISRIKMKANDTLTSSETATDEAIALGIDISKTDIRLHLDTADVVANER
jgi:hypothetical protein